MRRDHEAWHVWTVPLTDDPHSQRIAVLSLPLDLTREEAERLGTFVRALVHAESLPEGV